MEGGVTPFSSSMAPSGSYILIVVSQPLTEEHKQIILQRLDKGLLSWDVSSTGCDLSGLEYAFSTNIKDSVTESDVLIQHSTESLGVEVLLSPTVRTLKQCVKNLLSTHTSHKQLIHAGYTFAGSGSWILENGTFSFAEFLEIFQQADVQNQKRCIINIHCAEEGDWSKTNFSRDVFTKKADVSLNPVEKVNHVPGSEHLIKCLNNALITQNLEEMMKPSPLVGNIRFNRPTIYMFPAGQGDCALFGINGFNMLIDGGFHRKPCSWDFIRHLDRLDAVLVTRIGESNVCGMSTLMKRNALNNANPQIGYVFCNIAENKSNPSKNGTTESKDDLIISVVGEGHNFVQTLNDLKLKPHQCWRDSSVDPFVLYHKVGQGTLEMHVLSPPRDSKEMKLFLSEWNAYKETFSGVKSELKGVEKMVPLSHATSICAILVWRPEDPNDTITRILFPGSAPQYKILEGLDKLKVLNILNHPVVTKASLNIPSSKVISNKVEKSASRTSVPNRNNTASPALSVSSIASRNGDIGNHKKDVREIKKVTKEIKTEHKDLKKEIKKEIKKDVNKEVKKDIKRESAARKDSLTKKEPAKDNKKEVKDTKKVVKKEIKDVKTVSDVKEVKSTLKKDSTPTSKAATEIKKASTAVKKSTTPIKKDVGKPPLAPKVSETKKAVSKVSEPKTTTKDANNRKSVEAKTISKTKTKTASPKAPATSKTKPVAVPKPGSKMTKAVAASSIVASAVAVTVAAVELNEKKDVIEDTEPEESEKEVEIAVESKDAVANEKSVEDVVSPLPPEALSPTPSDSVSLTPSDTLSSAPLETVSPTPPLPNEPISTEEKDVNEIKDLEQDMPFEQEKVAGVEPEADHEANDIDIEAVLAKQQTSSDMMSASFIAEKPLEDNIVEKLLEKTEIKEDESALTVDVDKENFREKDGILLEKDLMVEKLEENKTVEDNQITDEKEKFLEDSLPEKDVAEEKDILEEAEIDEEKDVTEEKDILKETEIDEEKDFAEEKEIPDEKDVSVAKEEADDFHLMEEKEAIQQYTFAESNNEDTETVQNAYSVQVHSVEEKDTVENVTESKFSDLKGDTDLEKVSVVENEIYEEKNLEDKDDFKEKLVEEKGAVDEKDLHEYDEEIENLPCKNDFKHSYEENAEIDERLAGLTMEGSFCASMLPSDEKDVMSATEPEHIQTIEKKDYEETLNYSADGAEEHFEKVTASMNESYFKSDYSNSGIHEDKNPDEFIEKELDTHMMENTDQKDAMKTEVCVEDFEKHESISQESHKIESSATKLVSDANEELIHDMPEVSDNKMDFEEPPKYAFESNESYLDKFSNMKSMEESFHQDSYGHYEPTNIDDLDMQETSVDEPEEIVRKESSVSITLNEESSEVYTDNWRRKSGTESEDDVDIGKYMSKSQAEDEDKLRVSQSYDSDEEDVVKSPTPHAVVDYEGQLDDVISTTKEELHDNKVIEGKEMYLNEKEDLDEKDKDSAEEPDTDDGEMIRHPTPPQMKYSEEEMRDPIGQHFITNLGLKPQVSDITDQPLYEEAEDSESERSVSPIIEQPVFGNAVEADFPELVTVSGGTTPSEPQSPKANFDSKKFANDGGLMEALSEHDISDSSTHSPSCQDGSTAFDLQGSERSVIEVLSLKDEEVLKTVDDNKQSIAADECTSEPVEVPAPEELDNEEGVAYDDKDDKQEDKKDTPSDEEESSSEDENSESHSKDKSDAMGDKSDVERDDRSDIHTDDKSDHQYDKSDIANDDDDKSDIHDDENLSRQQNKSIEHEAEDGFQKDFKSDLQDSDMEMHYDHKVNTEYEKQYAYGYQSKNSPAIFEQQDLNVGQEYDSKNHPSSVESHYFENKEILKATENDALTENVSSVLPSNMPLSGEEGHFNQDFPSFEKHTDRASENIPEYETKYASDSNSQQESSNYDAVISREPIASDYDKREVQKLSVEEIENASEIKESETSDTFQTNEAYFEYSKRDTNIHGFSSFACENENETQSVEPVGILSHNSQEAKNVFGNSDELERLQKHDGIQLHEDTTSQHSENFGISENRTLSEITESHAYGNASQFEENMCISKELYSDGSLLKNVISNESQMETQFVSGIETNVEETSFQIENSQIQSLARDETYECFVNPADKITGINEYHQNASYNDCDESYKTSHFAYGMESDALKFNDASDYKQSIENYSHSEEQYTGNAALFTESFSEKKFPSISTPEHFASENSGIIKNDFNDFTSEVIDLNSNDAEATDTDKAEIAAVNGKDLATFSLSSSTLTSECYSSELPHGGIITSSSQEVEKESTYLINNRFHSDSPEDNTMRSDSSPDAPYPADLPDKFIDLKNSMSIETCSETYIHSTEDYKNNMNFSITGDTIPISTQNNSLNANENNTYGGSSEDESSSPVRNNMSPYAYTNKAYAREEEDVDGNHIYKEGTTEVIKQVEFDGNNLQTLSTNQVGSVMNYSQDYQDGQYSTGANYDFHLEEWDKPMGLPTPPDSSQKTLKKGEKVTVKSKNIDANGKVHSPSVSSKLSSPLKKPKPKVAKESSSSPIYVDLAYVPQHADPHYCDVEFFKKIRARYYVISSVNPSKEVLNALLEAKKTWNEDISVTIIPTYETDTLGYWMAQNQNDLAEYSIDVSPSASRCTVNLQDHQTSCSAYRLEF